MNRSLFAFVPALFAIGAVAACSSAPADPNASRVESSSQALTICNCPLLMGDASCTCESTPDAGRCISEPGGPCGGFTQDPCSCAPGSKCIPNRIPDIPGRCAVCDPIKCPTGETWDRALCECVPTAPECVTAADCHGALPDLCKVCPNGGDGCAHFACVDHQCEIAFCP
jgi:hypothetical protein